MIDFWMTQLNRIKGFLDYLSRFLNVLAAGGIAAATTLVIVSSAMRYFVGRPFHFTEELCALLFMSLSILSVSYVLTLKRHIRITFVFNHIPHSIRGYVELVTCLVTVFFIAILIKETWNFSYVTFQLDGVSQDADIYLFPWMALIPFGLLVFEVIAITDTIDKIQNLLTRDREGYEGK